MKSYLLVITLFCAALALNAQANLGRKWDARFGGSGFESFYKIFRMPDGGYVMGGTSRSGQDGDKTSQQWGNGDYYVVRTDSVGNKLWDKSYGGSGYEVMFTMCTTFEGGVLLAGHSSSGADGDKTQPSRGGSDYWVVRLDPQGNKLWDKRYGGTASETLGDARQCADGGFILTGYSNSNAGGDKSKDNKSLENGWVVRIDSLGNLLWEETYQSANYLMLSAGLELPDGGFLFGGNAFPDSTYDISEYGSVGRTMWVARTDAQGAILWDKRYDGWGVAYMEATLDGGFVLLGGGGSPIIRIDSTGNQLWRRLYDGGGYATGLAATSDGGFLLSEYTGYYAPSLDKTEFSMPMASQTWVLKIDANGIKAWDKTIFSWETNGGYAIESTQGCYVVGTSCRGGIGGYKTQPNWDTSLVTADFWLVKLCEGWVDTTLCPQQPCTNISEPTPLQAKLYPNPTTNHLTIELPNTNGQEHTLTLYNLLGQRMYEAPLTGTTTTLQINLTPGLYLYQIHGNGPRQGVVQNGKLVVE